MTSLKFPITAKFSVLVLVAVVATAFAINAVYLRGINQILIDRALHDLEQETDFFKYPLDGIISELKENLRLLVQLPAVPGLMRARQNNGVDPQDRATEAQWTDRLATIFSGMLRTHPRYLRIRLAGIADQGRELAKVERSRDQIVRAEPSQLLQVADQDYFQEILRFSPDTIYLSPMQLSREAGQITLPHTLTLRVGLPVYGPDQKIFGILTINADLGALLSDMKQQLPSKSTLYVTNIAGDYLVHPDQSFLYASDLSHDRRIQQNYPNLQDVTLNRTREKVTFVPDDTVQGNVLAYRKYRYDPLNPDNFLGIAVEAPYSSITSKTEEVQQRGLLFSAAIALLGLLGSLFFVRLFMRPLNRIAEAVVRYRKGEKDIALPVDSPDEIGVLAREFQIMVRQKTDEDWVKGHLAAISKNLLGIRQLQIFANMLMQSVAIAIDAQLGVFYIANVYGRKDYQRDADTLSFLGAYGHTPNDNYPQSFRWGEGLVGQCAKNRQPLLVTDIPADYLRISSALGGSTPKHLLLLPVVFENTVVGVIELGSVNAFTPIQQALLDQLTFNVGVIINSIAASMRTEELLEESRMTAEELQRGEEELKTQQEELQASNEELEEKTLALEEQNAQIRQQAGELQTKQLLLQEKAQELELSGKYKSEFLANMSHELRTPLNSLLILARSLASNEEGNLTEEQVEEARVIHNGGLELLSLINDILDLSKVEAGKLTIIPEDTPIAGIVKRLRQQFDPVAKEAGLVFNIEVEDDVPAALHTDSQRVEQILKNLLSNAFKFTENGSVTLNLHRAGESRQRGAQSKSAVGFAVIDTGIGIEPDKLRDIFEAFQQEDGSIDRHYGGTGLGLTIARKFAHLLGGEIHVESSKGEGSAFTLVLPMMLESKATAEPQIEQALAVRQVSRIQFREMPKPVLAEFIPDDRKHIGEKDKVLLVIEDDRPFAEILMKTARQHGYKCLAAGDGRNGLFLAIEYPVNAIILDLKLPDIDGMNVLDHLKSDLRTRHMPVHIISANDETESATPLRKGAIGYLTKPVDKAGVDGVFAKIEALLQSDLKQVLIVEDDEKNQIAIQKLLRKKDLQLTVVGSGGMALAEIQKTHFDCVILDLQLPDMTGFDLLKKMEQEGLDAIPPIVIYTARELSEDENRELNRYTGSIIIKGAKSPERLLDEVTLFLHSVGSTLSKEQQELLRMQHNPDRVLEGRTVLLTDDDLRNTFALSKLLKKHGMNVIIADNGQMALQRLQDHSDIELVIMDIMMPVMDGYLAIQEIRAQTAFQGMPIIALTARAMPEEQEKCIAAGANDYLAKPVDIERLLMLLRVWLFKHELAA